MYLPLASMANLGIVDCLQFLISTLSLFHLFWPIESIFPIGVVKSWRKKIGQIHFPFINDDRYLGDGPIFPISGQNKMADGKRLTFAHFPLQWPGNNGQVAFSNIQIQSNSPWILYCHNGIERLAIGQI
jgi:hypothetical protein